MRTTVDRAAAFAIFSKYNKGEYRHEHAAIMERTMRSLAERLGYGEEKEYWAVVGLLHDLDYELDPDQHCIAQQEMMRKEGLGEDVIRAAASHGWGKSVEIKPEHEMEKVLYLANELTVLLNDLAKKTAGGDASRLANADVLAAYNQPDYGATYPHLVIERGTAMLGWTLDEAIEKMKNAMSENSRN